MCTQSESRITRASRLGTLASCRAASSSGKATFVSPLAGNRSIVSSSSIGFTSWPRPSRTAASDQNAMTASASRPSSPASAPTVAAAVWMRSPLIDPDTSTSSTTLRLVSTRSRTMMSSSSGTGRSASISIVRSRSISSDPPRYGRLASLPEPRRAIESLLGRGIARRAAIWRALARTTGSIGMVPTPANTSSPSSSVIPAAVLPGGEATTFALRSARWARSTVPPPPVDGSKTVGSASSCLGLRRSGVLLRFSRGRPSLEIGESASTSLQPGSAMAGSRMKWSSQISRSTRSGVVSTASSRWIRPDSATIIAS